MRNILYAAVAMMAMSGVALAQTPASSADSPKAGTAAPSYSSGTMGKQYGSQIPATGADVNRTNGMSSDGTGNAGGTGHSTIGSQGAGSGQNGGAGTGGTSAGSSATH